MPGVTDVQVGSYIFMDAQYLEIGGESSDEIYTDFVPSLTVMTTVLNTYFPKSITTDAGAKALTLNKPGRDGDRREGVRLQRRLGRVRRRSSYEKAAKTYKVGDKLELIVPHCDPVGQRVRPDLRHPQGSRRSRCGRSPRAGIRSSTAPAVSVGASAIGELVSW